MTTEKFCVVVAFMFLYTITFLTNMHRQESTDELSTRLDTHQHTVTMPAVDEDINTFKGKDISFKHDYYREMNQCKNCSLVMDDLMYSYWTICPRCGKDSWKIVIGRWGGEAMEILQ